MRERVRKTDMKIEKTINNVKVKAEITYKGDLKKAAAKCAALVKENRND